MCTICSEWIKGKLTNQEALRNLGEIINLGLDDDDNMTHYFEVVEKILDQDEATKT